MSPQPATMSATAIARCIDEMARRRGVQRGYLYERNGLWYLRWKEDKIDAHGRTKRGHSKPYLLARSTGIGKITKKAARLLQLHKMAEVNKNHGPRAALTVAEFIEHRFEPDRRQELTSNGQRHYKSVFAQVNEAFGDRALADVGRSDVSRWLQGHAGAGKSSLRGVRSSATAYTRSMSTLRDLGMYEGRNPAHRIKIPRNARPTQKTRPYTLEELSLIVSRLESPLREMALLGTFTSLGGAELAGLRVGHLNLTDGYKWIEDENVPAWSLYACESYTNGEYTRGKNEGRRRILPIPEALRLQLAALAGERPAKEPLFFMPRTFAIHKKALPIDTGNISQRVFRDKLGDLGIRVTWHRFRATQATLADQMLADKETRRTMMGHAHSKMTEHYVDPLEKQRRVADAIAALVMGEPKGGIQ